MVFEGVAGQKPISPLESLWVKGLGHFGVKSTTRKVGVAAREHRLDPYFAGLNGRSRHMPSTPERRRCANGICGRGRPKTDFPFGILEGERTWPFWGEKYHKKSGRGSQGTQVRPIFRRLKWKVSTYAIYPRKEKMCKWYLWAWQAKKPISPLESLRVKGLGHF